MSDDLKDIIYSDLYRYTGNNRRHSQVFLTYIEELMSSPEFRFISNFRRTQYHYMKTQNVPKDINYYLHTIAFQFYSIRLDAKSRNIISRFHMIRRSVRASILHISVA